MRLKLYRGWWYAVWRDEAGTQRRALRTQDRDAAQRALADFEKAAAAPRDTVAGIYAAYRAEKGTARAKEAWTRLEGAFGVLRPDQVTRLRCRTYAADRRKAGVGDGTIRTELTYLRAALRWHSPATAAQIEMPAKPPPKAHYLTRTQYAALLDAASTPHVRLFIILALSTAGRMGAILDLTWDRVDFAAGIITLAKGAQTAKGRATVPMTEGARKALLEAHQARTSAHVIEYGGEAVGKLRKAFARAAERAGLPWVTPHVLRHSAAVWMAEAGVPMAEIAQVLGHSNEGITFRVYARFSPSYLRRAISALEA